MEGVNLKNFLKSRKGVSQIIGSVFMLAVVASIGSVILISGIGDINTFTSFLDVVREDQVQRSIHESFIVEHVRFSPLSDKQVYIWIRNTGTDDITIETVTMVKINTQELVIFNDTSDQQIFPDDIKILANKDSDVTMPTISAVCTDWTSPTCIGTDYKISITTIEGTIISVAARPFNT